MISCGEASKRTPAANRVNRQIIRLWISRGYDNPEPIPSYATTGQVRIDNNSLYYESSRLALALEDGTHQVSHPYNLTLERARHWADAVRFELGYPRVLL